MLQLTIQPSTHTKSFVPMPSQIPGNDRETQHKHHMSGTFQISQTDPIDFYVEKRTVVGKVVIGGGGTQDVGGRMLLLRQVWASHGIWIQGTPSKCKCRQCILETKRIWGVASVMDLRKERIEVTTSSLEFGTCREILL